MYTGMTEFLGIDGETIEFEKYFPWIYNIGNSSKDPGRLAEEKHRTRIHRIIFMSTFNDIEWTKRNIDEICTSNAESETVREEIFARTLDVRWAWR